MSGPRFERLDGEARNHPAVRSWRRFSGDRADPAFVEVLQKARSKKRSRSVYRLNGVSTPGTTVIAKRCRGIDADRESAIYQQVLPRLPLAHPQFFGRIGGATGKNDTWIFIEEVLGQPYDSSRPEHRVLAGRWMATLHTTASEIAESEIPDVFRLGLDDYSEILETVQSGLSGVITNPALRPPDVRTLQSLVDQCDALRENWPRLSGLGKGIPRTLVHGDLNRANMLVARMAGSPTLIVFDWEKSGWGLPAMDLTRFLGSRADPDLDSYLETASRRWPDMDVATVRRLGYLGEVFRWLDAVRWQVERLRFEWVEHPMSRIRIYERWMRDIRSAAPWSPESSLERGEWLSAVPL